MYACSNVPTDETNFLKHLSVFDHLFDYIKQ